MSGNILRVRVWRCVVVARVSVIIILQIIMDYWFLSCPRVASDRSLSCWPCVSIGPSYSSLDQAALLCGDVIGHPPSTIQSFLSSSSSLFLSLSLTGSLCSSHSFTGCCIIYCTTC